MTISTSQGTESVTLKAACHVHSDWSYDGTWPLANLAAEFRRRGYHVLLMSEHDRGFTAERFRQYREACAAVSSARILVVPGIEYSDDRNIVHILTWGVSRFFGESRPTAALLAEIHAANGIAVLAHPCRREAWARYSSEWARHLLGVEVWNRKTDGWAPSWSAPAMVRHGNLLPFVGMDFHDRRQLFPLAMQLQCPGELDEASVLLALRTRRCQPLIFGRPLTVTTRGGIVRALRALETCRRMAAASYRRCKRALAA